MLANVPPDSCCALQDAKRLGSVRSLCSLRPVVFLAKMHAKGTWLSFSFASFILSALLWVRRDLLVNRCHQHSKEIDLFSFSVNVSPWRRKTRCAPVWLEVGTQAGTREEEAGGSVGCMGRDFPPALPDVPSLMRRIPCQTHHVGFICNYRVSSSQKRRDYHMMWKLCVFLKALKDKCFGVNTMIFNLKWRREEMITWCDFSQCDGSSMESTGKS